MIEKPEAAFLNPSNKRPGRDNNKEASKGSGVVQHPSVRHDRPASSKSMINKPIVLVIDNEHWPRAYLRAELIEQGFEAIGYARLSAAVAALRRGSIARPAVIVLELRGQHKEPRWLEELTSAGIPTLLFTGPMEMDERIERDYRWTGIMHRPFTIGSAVKKIQEIVDAQTARSKLTPS